MWNSEDLYDRGSDLNCGYRAFSIPTPHCTGVLIVASNPEIIKNLSNNDKFERFKNLGSLTLFNSKDIGKYLTVAGLPAYIENCILKLFAMSLT
jgi:hypothetical protein